MASRSYVGGAPLVAKVVTVTPGGTIAATDTFTASVGTSSFTFTATTTTVAHVVTGLVALIQAAQTANAAPEWSQITVTDSTTTMTCTAKNAGEDFTIVCAISNVSGGAAPTLTAATTTANSGPEQYDLAANWSGGAIPANGDTVTIEGSFNLRYGDLSAVTAARLIVRDYSGDYGLPPTNALGNYREYRSEYVLLSATQIDVLQNVSASILNFGVGTIQTLANVYSSGSAGTTTNAFRLSGTHASNVLNFLNGSGGIATESGEATTLATFTQIDGELELGLGCTLTDGTVDGGTLRLYADMSGALTINAGEVTMIDDPDITGTTKVYSKGTLIVNGGPTFTGALSIFGGTLDLSSDTRAVVTTAGVTVYPGSTIKDPYKRLGSCTVTFAGGASEGNTNLDLGPNRVHAVSG